MNRIAGVIKIHLQDRWSWVLLPWLIITISFTCNLVIGAAMDEENFYTGGLASIYVYMLVMGILCVNQSFPLAIGFGVRRKDFFLGTAVTIFTLGAIFGIVLWGLGFLENNVTNGWGVHLHFFHLPYVSDGSALMQIWVNFTVITSLFFIGFVIACLYRRFGKQGLYTLLISLLLVFTISGYLMNHYDRWGVVGNWLASSTAVGLGSGMFGAGLILAFLSYLLLRRSTV
ncbi:hypothetical protein EBB07_26075 [Paenibacillaceae bacterium]|nr:hypothetical protein EBB07_26075 [Paenibacillaceae bacterium]